MNSSRAGIVLTFTVALAAAGTLRAQDTPRASASNQAGRRPRASRRQHRCRRRRARHGADRKRLHAGSRRPYAAHRLGAVHQRRARNTDRCCVSADLQHERCRRWALDHARRRPREHRARSRPSGHGGRQPLSVAPDASRSRRPHRISRTRAEHRLHLQPRSDSEGVAWTIWTHGYVADDLPHRRVRGDGHRPGRPHGVEHRHAARMRLGAKRRGTRPLPEDRHVGVAGDLQHGRRARADGVLDAAADRRSPVAHIDAKDDRLHLGRRRARASRRRRVARANRGTRPDHDLRPADRYLQR